MPAAGLSTRFPNMRPKYTLTDFEGRMMFEKSLSPFIGKHNITIGILEEHNQQYNIQKYIDKHYKNEITVVVLKERTQGPADTVYQIIKEIGLQEEEIFIKDCDSFFDHEYQEGNYVCVSSIKDHEILKRISSKSFIISNNQGIITGIVEKEVVSDKFCVGGYKFESADLFATSFEKLKDAGVSEIFVSHVIEQCLNSSYIFKEAAIKNYYDVGTAEDWFSYNDKAVLFCDIDGTIIKAQPKGNYEAEPIVLEQNVKRLKELVDAGSTIVFTTARHPDYDERTKEILNSLGFTDYGLISGLPNTKRILINDYNAANPYPRAIAVNIKRDSDNLSDYI